MAENITAFDVHEVSFSYGNRRAVDDVSFAVSTCEIVGVLGPNGAGKSTLLSLIAGNRNPSSGEILLFGTPISEITCRERAKKIAFVAQSPSIAFSITALETVLMGRTPHIPATGFESKGDIDIALDAMKMVDCEEFADRDISELSGGERQRVFLARAIAQRPEILIMDEPTTFLDIGHLSALRKTVTRLRDQLGMTVIIAAHDINFASALCSRILLMRDGRIISEGTPQETIRSDRLTAAFQTDVRTMQDPQTGRPLCLMGR